MTNLDIVINELNSPAKKLNHVCKIKNYLTVKEKFKFMDEFKNKMDKFDDDFKEYGTFITFIVFNLLAVKYYTNIELNITYEEFDKLQNNDIIAKLIEIIEVDYNLLMNALNVRQ